MPPRSPAFRTADQDGKETPSLVFELPLQYDVEAELEEFILLARLGLVEEAKRFHRDVLRAYDHLFPVFAELVSFYLDIDRPESLVSLVDRFEVEGHIFTSSDQHEMLLFLQYVVHDMKNDCLDPISCRHEYTKLFTSYVNTIAPTVSNDRFEARQISSVQAQTCEILLYGASRTHAEPLFTQYDTRIYFESLLTQSYYWEAAQSLNILASTADLSSLNDCLDLYDIIERNLESVAHKDELSVGLALHKARWACSTLLNHNLSALGGWTSGVSWTNEYCLRQEELRTRVATSQDWLSRLLQGTTPGGLYNAMVKSIDEIGSRAALAHSTQSVTPWKAESSRKGPVRVSSCIECRRLKIRCDNIQPTCGRCSETNRTCVYRKQLSYPSWERESTVAVSSKAKVYRSELPPSQDKSVRSKAKVIYRSDLPPSQEKSVRSYDQASYK